MNEKLKKLAEQAGYTKDMFGIGHWDMPECIRFAELVEEEERKECAKQYLEITRDAVKKAILREREACAKLCDELSNRWYDEGGSANDCAAAIRGRTE